MVQFDLYVFYMQIASYCRYYIFAVFFKIIFLAVYFVVMHFNAAGFSLFVQGNCFFFLTFCGVPCSYLDGFYSYSVENITGATNQVLEISPNERDSVCQNIIVDSIEVYITDDIFIKLCLIKMQQYDDIVAHCNYYNFEITYNRNKTKTIDFLY